MALKDCTYTVKVGGETVTFDYDGFRSFLLDNKNLAAVAPVFAGKRPSAPSTATPASKGSKGATLRQGVEPDIVNEIGPLWRSTLGPALESWANKGTPEQLMAHIAKTKGATEEAKWVELGKFLEGKKTVTKQEVLDYLETNPFILGEVNASGYVGNPKFNLPGAATEKELIITSPRAGRYEAPHYVGVSGYLVHVRFNERVNKQGQRVLFIEEIQSDLHQTGRKTGYRTQQDVDKAFTLVQKTRELLNEWQVLRRSSRELAQQVRDLLPDTELTVGNVQAKARLGEGALSDLLAKGDTASRVLRGSFSQLVKIESEISKAKLAYETTSAKALSVELLPPDAPYKQTGEWAILAVKRMIRWAAENGYDEVAWAGGGTQTERAVGTEFYKFYDEILPKSLGKFIRQWGATIEQTDIEIPGKGVITFPAVKMSPRMKNAALQGMTLFQKEKLPSPQAPAKGKIDPADLIADWRGKVDLTTVPPVKESKHVSGAEARKALQDLAKNTVREEMELQRLYREMRRVRQPLLEGTRGMTQAQVDELESEFNAVKDAYIQALAKQRLRAIDEVAPGGLANITWEGYQTEKEVITTGKYSSEFEKAVKGVSKDAQQRVNEGVELFKRIVGDHPALRGKKLDVRILGRGEGVRRERYSFTSIDKLNDLGLSGKPALGGGHVMLTAKTPNNIIVHEMGHWMEHAVPETTKRISQFLKRRAGKERLSSMSKLGGDNYHSDELAVKDEFITPYIGKYYAPGMPTEGDLPDWDRIQASEVLSMGLQYMSEDPVKFAQKDPEMFDLIFDILRMGR